jgi:membrane protein DedA with SNARE-associated domain
MPEWLLDLFARYGYAVVFGGVFLENTGLPVPGETVLLAGATLAHFGQLSLVRVIATAIGAISATTSGSSSGAAAGGGSRRRHGWRIDLTRDRLVEFDRFFDRHGPKTVFAARFVPACAWSAPSWPAGQDGLARVPPLQRQRAVVWCTAVACAGYSLAIAGPPSSAGLAAPALALALVVAIGIIRFVRATRSSP